MANSDSLDPMFDRWRLRRKLFFWRLLSILFLLGIVGALASRTSLTQFGKYTPHIARISFEGIITDNRAQVELLKELARSPSVKGVVIHINSPGGTTVGGEVLYTSLRAIAEKKPVAAHIGTVGASAGYMLALAADQIFAHYNTVTGSIGVLFQYAHFEKMLDTLGISVDAVRSGALKATPSLESPPSEETKAMLKTLVDDTFSWFLDLVRTRRKLSRSVIEKLSLGGIYTGHQAHQMGLIDALGDETQAVFWIESQLKSPQKLPVLDWQPPRNSGRSSFFGVEGAKNFFLHVFFLIFGEKKGQESGILVDGLLSIWQKERVR